MGLELQFRPEQFTEALGVIGWSALGTFLAVGIIIGATVLLNFLTKKK